jgi:hypothetical protein
MVIRGWMPESEYAQAGKLNPAAHQNEPLHLTGRSGLRARARSGTRARVPAKKDIIGARLQWKGINPQRKLCRTSMCCLQSATWRRLAVCKDARYWTTARTGAQTKHASLKKTQKLPQTCRKRELLCHLLPRKWS